MTLWEFYDAVRELSSDLRLADQETSAVELEDALRGGTTSGEILTNLSVALGHVDPSPLFDDRVDQARRFIDEALNAAP